MEVICVGEMLIDFTPGSQPASYIRNPGGAPANACIASARNGISTGFLGKLGNVHKTVLMDTDIYESAEINDVSDGSL